MVKYLKYSLIFCLSTPVFAQQGVCLEAAHKYVDGYAARNAELELKNARQELLTCLINAKPHENNTTGIGASSKLKPQKNCDCCVPPIETSVPWAPTEWLNDQVETKWQRGEFESGSPYYFKSKKELSSGLGADVADWANSFQFDKGRLNKFSLDSNFPKIGEEFSFGKKSMVLQRYSQQMVTAMTDSMSSNKKNSLNSKDGCECPCPKVVVGPKLWSGTEPWNYDQELDEFSSYFEFGFTNRNGEPAVQFVLPVAPKE